MSELTESPPATETRWGQYRVYVVLGAVILFSYAYFYQGGGYNQNARFDLTRAIVEHRSLRIDRYANNTGDLAYFEGHVYPAKAPGASFIAVPVVAALRPVLRIGGMDPNSTSGIAWLSYAATIATATIPTAVAALCLFWLTQRTARSRGAPLFVAIVFALGTPMWLYATLFAGHALAAAWLIVSFAAAVALRDDGDSARDTRLAITVGVAGGWAIVTDFTTALPVALIAGLTLVNAASRPNRLGYVMYRAALGGLASLWVLGLYQYVAFRSPFHSGYASDQFKTTASFHTPSPHVVGELLWGTYRGLLPLAPVLAVAPIGFVLMWRARQVATACVAAGIVVYYVLLNAGYQYWWGGSLFGPRHLVPALPFLCLLLGPVFDAANRAWRAVLVLAAAFGVFVSLLVVTTGPDANEIVRNPVWNSVWPAFRSGDLARNCVGFNTDVPTMLFAACTPERAVAWNLGQEAFRLNGLVSLLPLFVIWGAGVYAWLRVTRDKPVPTSPELTTT